MKTGYGIICYFYQIGLQIQKNTYYEWKPVMSTYTVERYLKWKVVIILTSKKMADEIKIE